MIQQYDILFNREEDYIEIIQKAKDENGQFLSSNLNADTGVGISNLDKLKQHFGMAPKEEEEDDDEDEFLADMKKADEEFKQRQNETQAANNDNNQQWNEMREQMMVQSSSERIIDEKE